MIWHFMLPTTKSLKSMYSAKAQCNSLDQWHLSSESQLKASKVSRPLGEVKLWAAVRTLQNLGVHVDTGWLSMPPLKQVRKRRKSETTPQNPDLCSFQLEEIQVQMLRQVKQQTNSLPIWVTSRTTRLQKESHSRRMKTPLTMGEPFSIREWSLSPDYRIGETLSTRRSSELWRGSTRSTSNELVDYVKETMKRTRENFTPVFKNTFKSGSSQNKLKRGSKLIMTSTQGSVRRH